MKFKLVLFSVFLFVNFSITSCSGSEDEPTIEPFLEKYEGTKWILNSTDNVEPPALIVMRIKNNINKPFEGWSDWGCYNYMENFMIHSPSDITIVENENDKLVYAVNDSDFPIANGIVTVHGNTLTQRVQWESNWFTVFIWIQSTIDVDNLSPLCN